MPYRLCGVKWRSDKLWREEDCVLSPYVVCWFLSGKKWREIIHRSLIHITNMKYHIAYLFVSFLMTLENTEGHLQDLSNAIRRTFVRHSARFQLTRRVARSLGDSWASWSVTLYRQIWVDWLWLVLRGAWRFDGEYTSTVLRQCWQCH